MSLLRRFLFYIDREARAPIPHTTRVVVDGGGGGEEEEAETRRGSFDIEDDTTPDITPDDTPINRPLHSSDRPEERSDDRARGAEQMPIRLPPVRAAIRSRLLAESA